MASSIEQRAHRREPALLRGTGIALAAMALAAAGWVAADPRPFRVYPGAEYEPYELSLPKDFDKRSEWTIGRLMFPSTGYGSEWQHGYTDWTIDYPKADRHIAQMIGRLSIIDARSAEQPVNLDDGDDVFNWPWLYAVEVGTWELTNAQAAKLREYLLRGGFLMIDDFHGTLQWNRFMEGMKRVFPDRVIVDIPHDDPIFNAFWDIDDFSQIPGLQYIKRAPYVPYEQDGYTAEWRGIYDDEGRIMVAICHNMDLGDAVEHSDNIEYPQDWSARAMRTFLNYVIYSMTH
jgi:hypothetical protein